MDRILGGIRYRLDRWQFGRKPGVSLSEDAAINASAITMHSACQLRVGPGSIVEAQIDLERDGAVFTVGANSYVGASIFKCAERIEIGNGVEIAWNCSIVDHDWEPLVWEERSLNVRKWYSAEKDWSHVAVAPVRIDDKALICFNAIILKGVRVGEGAVVGVGSVVTRDVPPYTVAAGNPARVIRDVTSAVQGRSTRGQ